MDLLDRLVEHDHWATTELLELSRDLTDAQLAEPFDIGHRTLRATFDHMIFNLGFWTALATSQPFEGPQDDRSRAALADRHERFYETFSTFARRVCDEQRLDDTFTDHYDSPMTFGGAILHVILHNAEHRTEVLHILERLGVPNLPEIDHALCDYKRRGLFTG
jgi:uncharacterized damage-inducible protein DinB